MSFARIFSDFIGCLFILLMVSFAVQELFKLGCLLPVELLRVLCIFWIYKDVPDMPLSSTPLCSVTSVVSNSLQPRGL